MKKYMCLIVLCGLAPTTPDFSDPNTHEMAFTGRFFYRLWLRHKASGTEYKIHTHKSFCFNITKEEDLYNYLTEYALREEPSNLIIDKKIDIPLSSEQRKALLENYIKPLLANPARRQADHELLRNDYFELWTRRKLLYPISLDD